MIENLENNKEEVIEEKEVILHEELTSEQEEKIEEAIQETNKVEEGNRAGTILEGLLFIVGEEGITLAQASEVLGISQERAEEEFNLLQAAYAEDSRGFEIASYGGTYKFLSKAIVHPYAEKLFQTTKTAGISQAALETLAIIAYKQPITRVEIEEIRGVGCDMMLRKLEARNLIRENGRSDAPGRPILYEVTDEFMDSFKLYSLDELPKLPEFNTDENSENLFD